MLNRKNNSETLTISSMGLLKNTLLRDFWEILLRAMYLEYPTPNI